MLADVGQLTECGSAVLLAGPDGGGVGGPLAHAPCLREKQTLQGSPLEGAAVRSR